MKIPKGWRELGHNAIKPRGYKVWKQGIGWVNGNAIGCIYLERDNTCICEIETPGEVKIPEGYRKLNIGEIKPRGYKLLYTKAIRMKRKGEPDGEIQA